MFWIAGKTSPGSLFQMKGAEYEYERYANSVFVLGIVSSGSAIDRVWGVATCWTRCWLTCRTNLYMLFQCSFKMVIFANVYRDFMCLFLKILI